MRNERATAATGGGKEQRLEEQVVVPLFSTGSFLRPRSARASAKGPSLVSRQAVTTDQVPKH